MSALGHHPSLKAGKGWLQKLNLRRPKQDFLSICLEIREALRESLRPPNADRRRQFIPEEALKEVWLSREGRVKSRLDLFHNRLTALERDPGIHEKYLRLLSTLLWIQYQYDGWRDFARAFQELSISDRQGWQDDKFPLQDEKPLHSLFESEIDFDTYAQNFLRDQYLFSPAKIHEMRVADCDAEIKPFPEPMRLPFPDAEMMLHHGTHRVTRRKVAGGGIESLTGDSMEVVAVKTFTPEQRLHFVTELWNLKQLRKASSIHPNVQPCFSAIQIGLTGHLIFEPAECNLSQILHWQEQTFSAGFCANIKRDLRPSFLLWEAKDLSNALHWLHNGFSPKNSNKFKCYHLDLKPDNILVFPPPSPDLQGEIWTWKIADFGGSVIEHKSSSRSGMTPSGRRLRTGGYQAPEIASNQYELGTAADIWSFGCILLEILAFANGGPSSVRDLERVRNSNGRPHFYDRTFNLREDIRDWIDRLDIDEEGLREFRDQIYRLLKRNPEDRPEAQDLDEPLDNAWNRVKSLGSNDVISPAPSEAPTSEQATDIEIPTNDPPLIRIKNVPQEIGRSVTKLVRKTPLKCRVSSTGNCAIVQTKSERNHSPYFIYPGWNESPSAEPRGLLSEEESHRYSAEKIAAEGTFCGALLRAEENENFQLLLRGEDKRTLRRSSSGTDLSISADGDCIVHGESKLRIFLRNSNRARELPLRGTLKRACFSRNGKWIYVWSRTPRNAMDHWQVFQVASDDQTPFVQSHHPFMSSVSAGPSRDILIALRDPSDESSIRPLFLTIDKHGNANVLIYDGNYFYVHSIQGEFSGYVGGAATEDGRSILLIHQSQVNRTPNLHVFDLDPEKLRTTDQSQQLMLEFDSHQAPYLKGYVNDTGISIVSEDSGVYAHFAVKGRKEDILLKRVLVGEA